MHTLLTVPWMVFGFKNPNLNFIHLNQSKTSFGLLVLVEICLWTILMLRLNSDPSIAGSNSFAWMNFIYFEKGVLPLQLIENIIPTGGDQVDTIPILYLIAALIIDYLLLLLIQPKTLSRFLAQ